MVNGLIDDQMLEDEMAKDKMVEDEVNINLKRNVEDTRDTHLN